MFCTGCVAKTTFTRKKKTVMLIAFIRLHPEKGGILAHRDVKHKCREQGTGNSRLGDEDLSLGTPTGNRKTRVPKMTFSYLLLTLAKCERPPNWRALFKLLIQVWQGSKGNY